MLRIKALTKRWLIPIKGTEEEEYLEDYLEWLEQSVIEEIAKEQYLRALPRNGYSTGTQRRRPI